MTFLFPEDDHEYYADEVGLTLAGLFAREASGLPRTGILALRPEITAVAGSWRVRVGQFTYVHQINRAVQLSGIENAQEVDITPASGNIPAGQARIDLVVYDPATAALSVVTGTPATSPVVPSAGSLVQYAQVRVNAADGGVLQSQITPVFKMTGFSSQQATWKQADSSLVPVDRVALRNGWVNSVIPNFWNGLQTRTSANNVEIQGSIRKDSPYAALEVVGILPPHMSPSVPVFLPASYMTVGRYMLVRPTGEIITVVAGSAGDRIHFGGIIPVEL